MVWFIDRALALLADNGFKTVLSGIDLSKAVTDILLSRLNVRFIMYKRVRNTNAWVEREGRAVRLMSYETLVCEVYTDSRIVLLSPAARCSRTTIDHLNEFLREFGISYYDAKSVLVDPSHEPVTTENGFKIHVSEEPRFRFRPTSPFCLI